MQPFTKNYFDMSATDVVDLTASLEHHPVVVAQAKANDITPAKAISEALAMWRAGEIHPVHDNEGMIVGFA